MKGNQSMNIPYAMVKDIYKVFCKLITKWRGISKFQENDILMILLNNAINVAGADRGLKINDIYNKLPERKRRRTSIQSVKYSLNKLHQRKYIEKMTLDPDSNYRLTDKGRDKIEDL